MDDPNKPKLPQFETGSSDDIAGFPQSAPAPEPPLVNPVQVTPTPTPAPNFEQVSPPTITIESKRGKGFGVFVLIGIIIIIVVYGIVAFLYLQNRKLKESEGNLGDVSSDSVTQNTQIPTPVPIFKPEFVKIENGSVVYDASPEEKRVIIDKNNYSDTGIIGFLKVSVSPDNSKICFESWPPATKPGLYISSVEGAGVVQVGQNKINCLWTPEGEKLVYGEQTPPRTASNIYVYDMGTSTETVLTEAETTKDKFRKFDVVGLSADGTKIICTFTRTNLTNSTGQCEIVIETGEVTYPQAT